MSPRYPVFVLRLLSVVFAGGAQEVRGPIENPGFEHGKLGEAPPGWDNGGGYAGYPAQITNDNPNSGRQCGLLRTDPQSRVRDYGVLSQMIETAPFRKQAIHLRIFARASTNSEGWAAVFYRVDRSGGVQKSLFANRRITSKDWRHYDFDVEIPDDAVRMQFGVTLSGDGRVWVDDASVEIAGKGMSFILHLLPSSQ